MRSVLTFVAGAAAQVFSGGVCRSVPPLLCLFLIVGCSGVPSHQVGPPRAVPIDQDIASFKDLALTSDAAVENFFSLSPADQAKARNQIITVRMYLIDIEYSHYEARLTQELQNEGLGATLASLSLTTAATLIPVEQTSRVLSGIATAVTGADKAYSEKELLDNTVQALQGQMRIDRKTEAATIYKSMLTANGAPTSIDKYTLPMALSDTDQYYRAGTISSALVGLSKTVATAEHNADAAKTAAGPNATSVAAVKSIAAPMAGGSAPVTIPVPIASATAPITVPVLLNNPTPGAIGPFEHSAAMSPAHIKDIQNALCVSPDGILGPSTRAAIGDYLVALGESRATVVTSRINSELDLAIFKFPKCSAAGFTTATDVGKALAANVKP